MFLPERDLGREDTNDFPENSRSRDRVCPFLGELDSNPGTRPGTKSLTLLCPYFVLGTGSVPGRPLGHKGSGTLVRVVLVW